MDSPSNPWDTVMMRPMSSSSEASTTPSPFSQLPLEPQMSAANPLAPRKRGRPPNSHRCTDLREQYERRRLSNRLAAQRCRTRRAEEKKVLAERVAQLEKIVNEKDAEIRRLREELRARDERDGIQSPASAGALPMTKRPFPPGLPRPRPRANVKGVPMDLALLKAPTLPQPKAIRSSPRLANKALASNALNTPTSLFTRSEWAAFQPVKSPVDGILSVPSLLTPTTNSTIITSPTTSRNYALL